MICFHPSADILQALDRFRWEGAAGAWTDIEQIVAAAADHFDEVADQFSGRFPVRLCWIVRPALAHCHAGFPGLEMLGRGIRLLMDRRQLERAFAVFPHLLAKPTAHQRDRGQGTDQPEETIAAGIEAGIRFAGAGRNTLLGDELLGRDKVEVVAEPVVDERFRAEVVDQFVETNRIILAMIGQPIEPDHGHIAVIAEQFADVAFHVVEILPPFFALRFAGPVFCYRFAHIPVAGMVHIGWRIVKTERHPGSGTGLRQREADVLPIGGGCDLVVRAGRIEHAEPVVVFGGDDDVPHPGFFGDPYPLIGIEVHGVELRRQFDVFFIRDLGLRSKYGRRQFRGHDRPGCLCSCNGISPPVKEQAKLSLLIPCQGSVLILVGCDWFFHLIFLFSLCLP